MFSGVAISSMVRLIRLRLLGREEAVEDGLQLAVQSVELLPGARLPAGAKAANVRQKLRRRVVVTGLDQLTEEGLKNAEKIITNFVISYF
jgi:hypothetical protein